MTTLRALTLTFLIVFTHNSCAMRSGQVAAQSAKNALAAAAHYVPNAAPLTRHISYVQRSLGQHSDQHNDPDNQSHHQARQPLNVISPKALEEPDLMLAAEHNAHDKELKNRQTLIALQQAAELRDTKELQQLIDAKADVNAADDDGITALHISALGLNTNAVQVLVDNNASVDAKTKEGADALTLALISCKDLEMAVPLAIALNNLHTTRDTATPLAKQLMRSNDTLRILLNVGASIYNIDLQRVTDALMEESEDEIAAFHAHARYRPILK